MASKSIRLSPCRMVFQTPTQWPVVDSLTTQTQACCYQPSLSLVSLGEFPSGLLHSVSSSFQKNWGQNTGPECGRSQILHNFHKKEKVIDCVYRAWVQCSERESLIFSLLTLNETYFLQLIEYHIILCNWTFGLRPLKNQSVKLSQYSMNHQ